MSLETSLRAQVVNKVKQLSALQEEAIKSETSTATTDQAVATYNKIIFDESNLKDDELLRIKEEAIYRLGDLYCRLGKPVELSNLLKQLRPFFQDIPKAKTAKIVRTIIELVGKIPNTQDVQIELCKDSIEWSQKEKRTFLRQRIEARLAALYFEKSKYTEAQALIAKLLREVRRLDDKALLVEIQLLDSYVWTALSNIAKARAALTSARSAAAGIYCPPLLQADIDMQSGILHAQEKDYKTAFSYFFESFEGYSNLNNQGNATRCLKYMLLCKIMTHHPEDVSTILSSKNVLKTDAVVETKSSPIESMRAISKAYQARSLHDFEASLKQFKAELIDDPIVNTHLNELYDNLLEQHLLRIIEPFSRVEISHVAQLINIARDKVERKLSQMILDKKLNGILDAGKDCLVVYDDVKQDKLYTHAHQVVDNMNTVLDSLFERGKQLMK
jgi:26S proteasome regulatory subunit N6